MFTDHPKIQSDLCLTSRSDIGFFNPATTIQTISLIQEEFDEWSNKLGITRANS